MKAMHWFLRAPRNVDQHVVTPDALRGTTSSALRGLGAADETDDGARASVAPVAPADRAAWRAALYNTRRDAAWCAPGARAFSRGVDAAATNGGARAARVAKAERAERAKAALRGALREALRGTGALRESL
jgi:hypothetical protein